MADGVMIVTGGSRGIGAATAKAGAKAGYAVVVNYASNEAAANAVVADIEAAGGKAVAVKGDVGVEADILAIFEAADRLGPLTALINNAGIVDEAGTLADMTAARLERMFRINITGSILCAREAAKRMGKCHGGKGGAIVNLSSVAAKLGGPGQYLDYAASKGAIDTLTVGLAKELIDDGIRVCAVRPGIIDTDIHASGGQPDRVAQLGPGLPMKRAGTAQEVAGAILWLASDEASYSTGAILDVSGARSIWP
ncbi:dehydrogenase [Aurantimonas manganoxydans SI85-9A1]|uniref:Dehydrogenase n=2 Tax=Aurantimonas manganoxydans TaxID=651183 RepID=Q1YE09_AURMS|nr:SDR family oxidoreductase [Aurantimonas manganoxydans]EAS48449.1 dehydrogenase [Aurantimonas manganoxydans SI85-9A1]BAT29024.1 oxidoreductase [Aurantimonas manganoxydans SI85-9A1]